MLVFVNSVVDSDDNNFKAERRFSDIFNTFMNQWCEKKIKRTNTNIVQINCTVKMPQKFCVAKMFHFKLVDVF